MVLKYILGGFWIYWRGIWIKGKNFHDNMGEATKFPLVPLLLSSFTGVCVCVCLTDVCFFICVLKVGSPNFNCFLFLCLWQPFLLWRIASIFRASNSTSMKLITEYFFLVLILPLTSYSSIIKFSNVYFYLWSPRHSKLIMSENSFSIFIFL